MKIKLSRVATQDQAGFASLVIAIVLVLVLSLTTVGFADLMRSEQKSALNKHLSSQAYYAAESGVNDAALAINHGFTAKKDTCGQWEGPATAGDEYLDAAHMNVGGAGAGTSYTCLLIDPNPPTVEFTSVNDSTDAKTVILTGINPLNTNDIVPIRALVIGWQEAGDNPAPSFTTNALGTFPKKAGWTSGTGVLRVGLTSLASGEIGRQSLSNNFFAAFLYPKTSTVQSAPGVVDYSISHGANAGEIGDGKCNQDNRQRASGDSPRFCNVRVTGLDSTNYLLNLRSTYKASRVTVQAYGEGGQQILIGNAQTSIDATGKAQDVLRRIQVRIPSKDTYVRSNYALETTDSICKQLDLSPDSEATAQICD